jgi:hypothetical protein
MLVHGLYGLREDMKYSISGQLYRGGTSQCSGTHLIHKKIKLFLFNAVKNKGCFDWHPLSLFFKPTDRFAPTTTHAKFFFLQQIYVVNFLGTL